MSEILATEHWSEQQWSKIRQVVHDTARQARVAARFLPLFGPVPNYAETVPTQTVRESGSQRLVSATVRGPILEIDRLPPPNEETLRSLWPRGLADNRLIVDSSAVLPLITISIDIYLTTPQHHQPDLESALTLLGRAAAILARLEDAILFRGVDYRRVSLPRVYKVSRDPEYGLYPSGDPPCNSPECYLIAEPDGERLMEAVAQGVAYLDAGGYVAPYALVLGNDLFVIAETPQANSMVLPSDRIKPLIEGLLLRSGTLPCNAGVLISLAGNPVEIVVAEDIHVKFLQISPEPRYIYRVSERFVLRIKDHGAIVRLKCDKIRCSPDVGEADKPKRRAEVKR